MREPDFSGIARVWQIRHQPEMETAHSDSWGYVSSSLCDSDYRQWWKHSISETVRHYREGLHE